MRIDASSLLSVKQEITEVLKSLEAGDTLKGRIIEALGNSVAIRTASGQIFTAILTEGVKLQKGDFVELIVSSITDGKIYAELKADRGAFDMDEKVYELLKQLNLPADEKNLEAAKLLIKYKLPLNKETITNITGLQKSIDNLNQSSEGRISLLLSGLDIKNTPVDVLNKILLNGSSDLVNSESTERIENLENAGATNITQEESSQESEKTVIETINSLKTDSTKTNKEAAGDVNVHIVAKDRDVHIENNKGTELLMLLDKHGIEVNSEVKRFVVQIADILTSIKDTDMEAITYLISKNIEVTPKNLGQLTRNIKNSDGLSELLDKLQNQIDNDNPELKEIKASIKKVFLEPRQVEDSKEVSEQIKDIVKLGEKLEIYLKNSGNRDQEIRDTLSNLKDNIDFIRIINEQNNYMQLPLLINGNTSTAKLYVFKEGKRSKAINPEDTTILIALDLKNLGHMESLISVKGRMVNVTFRVENKSIGTLIEKQSLLLTNSLIGKGYSLSPVKVINAEQSFNLLSLEALIDEGNSAKLHFDMRV